MNRVHDLGGRDGFGSVEREPDEPVFHEPWEGRVFAMALLLSGAGCVNADEFRHAIERLDPATYLSAGYYGRWLGAVEKLVEEAGGAPRPRPGTRIDTLRPTERRPRFAAGDRVRTRNHQPAGHTRLPSYARTRTGKVAIVHPSFVFPDSNAHRRGEKPQHVYSVRFAGAELFGDRAEPGTFVHLDCFEDYLEPA